MDFSGRIAGTPASNKKYPPPIEASGYASKVAVKPFFSVRYDKRNDPGSSRVLSPKLILARSLPMRVVLIWCVGEYTVEIGCFASISTEINQGIDCDENDSLRGKT